LYCILFLLWSFSSCFLLVYHVSLDCPCWISPWVFSSVYIDDIV
jgi:hypothetical protein